jgi:hypothetical protein
VKTIYTDKYGFYPWMMLAVAGLMFKNAYDGFSEQDGSQLGLGIASGGVFLFLALQRFWDIRKAKRENRDHTIVRVTEDRGS